jgi:hypothetical protein
MIPSEPIQDSLLLFLHVGNKISILRRWYVTRPIKFQWRNPGEHVDAFGE